MFRRRVSSPYGREAGVAVVELALVLPLLMVLLLGILDFGRAFNYWIDQTHLANEGARWAAVNKNPGSGTLQEYVRSQANTAELREGGTASVPGPIEICISFPNGTSQVGDPVRVTASASYNWLPFLGDRIGITSTSISAAATMRLEAAPSVYTAGCS